VAVVFLDAVKEGYFTPAANGRKAAYTQTARRGGRRDGSAMVEGHRRQVLIVAGAFLAPRIVFAQVLKRKRRIGFLSVDTANSGTGEHIRKTFPAELEKLGYQQGANLEIEWRWADANPGRLPALAADLVHLQVDLIVARTTDPIVAAKKATQSIPIVMMNANFPVELGLVQSLARPDANVTGTSYISSETLGKGLQLLKEIAPSVRRVAVPIGRTSGATRIEQLILDSLTRAGGTLGMAIQHFPVPRLEDLPAALERIAASDADSLFYLGDPVLRSRQEDIATFVRARKLPAVASVFSFADQGGLAEYFADPSEWLQTTARFVDRILKGARPADLPVQQPSKFLLTINLKTAKAIGLTIPASILVRVDRVIE